MCEQTCLLLHFSDTWGGQRGPFRTAATLSGKTTLKRFWCSISLFLLLCSVWRQSTLYTEPWKYLWEITTGLERGWRTERKLSRRKGVAPAACAAPAARQHERHEMAPQRHRHETLCRTSHQRHEPAVGRRHQRHEPAVSRRQQRTAVGRRHQRHEPAAGRRHQRHEPAVSRGSSHSSRPTRRGRGGEVAAYKHRGEDREKSQNLTCTAI